MIDRRTINIVMWIREMISAASTTVMFTDQAAYEPSRRYIRNDTKATQPSTELVRLIKSVFEMFSAREKPLRCLTGGQCEASCRLMVVAVGSSDIKRQGDELGATQSTVLKFESSGRKVVRNREKVGIECDSDEAFTLASLLSRTACGS